MEPGFDDADAAAVRAGDPEAIAKLWQVTVRPLMGYLRAQGLDEAAAEDLAQESFLELVRSCRQLTGDAVGIRAWLFRAAYRNLLDWRRARRRRPLELVRDEVTLDRPALDAAVDEVVEGRLEATALRGALERLSPDQAQVLTLRFLGGLTAAEVATILGKREGAVRALQHRAVAALVRMADSGAVTIQPLLAPTDADA